jgi:hypothetical protein
MKQKRNVTVRLIDAVVAADGLAINGQVFDKKLPLEHYQDVLGPPNRTIDAGLPAPAGHRNNQVHVFDSEGLYLTEHHASRLIESVNFVFDSTDSPFSIAGTFSGNLRVNGQLIRVGMPECDLTLAHLTRDLPGEYSMKNQNCWIGISAQGSRDSNGKRRKPRYVVRVSVCF